MTQPQEAVSVEDGDVALLQTDGDERVFITRDGEEGGTNENRGTEEGGQEQPASPPLTPPPSLPPKLSKDNYDIRSFNSSLDEFVGVLSNPRYQEMADDYPVDDLLSVVSMVSATIDEYKTHAQQTQRQLEALRDTMKTVKENLHLSVTRQAFDLRAEEVETVEEQELRARLTRLNATVAKAHAEVAEANQLSADTESTALQAHIAATQARRQSERIQEEAALREEMEKKRQEEEKRRREEEERRRQEEERRAEEEKRAKELAWRRQQEAAQAASGKRPSALPTWDVWPVVEYETEARHEEDRELICCIRGHPAKFHKEHVTCDVIEQTDVSVTYEAHEELISHVVQVASRQDRQSSEEVMVVAIPHRMSRASALSREPVVKCLVDGHWVELTTREVTFDHHKDVKFAQAETRHFTKFLVMSRYKRDYLTFTKRSAKATSSYDQRITINVARDTFQEKEHLLLQVQPADSASVNEFRARAPNGKALLTSSPILHMDWQTKDSFEKPVNISLPCPPNPAKARKMALLRKAKEERLKNAGRVVVPVLEEKPTEKPSKLQQAQAQMQEEGQPAPQRPNKWYMGQYGQTDDDENDELCFVGFLHGKWTPVPDVKITQVKLDLINLNLDFAWERFMVLRTRPGTEGDIVTGMARGLTEQLARRFVNVIVKQRMDDPYEACVHVVPVSRLDKALQQVAEEGYDEGPEPSPALSVQEGDVIVVSFVGNIRHVQGARHTLRMVYSSNMSTATYFSVCEVDRYLQKNYNLYRGLLHVHRHYQLPLTPAQRRDECPVPEVKSQLLCEMMLKIPKYHVEPVPLPKRAPLTLHTADSPVNQDTLRRLAADLGQEWLRLANKLHVQRVRIQAILRMQSGQGTEEQAKYDMLMTWLKRSPQAADKAAILASALKSVGRVDLAEQLRCR